MEFESPEDEAYYKKAEALFFAKKAALQRIAARQLGEGKSYTIFAKPTPMKEYIPKTMKDARAEIKSLRATVIELHRKNDEHVEIVKACNIENDSLRREVNMLTGLCRSICETAQSAKYITVKY